MSHAPSWTGGEVPDGLHPWYGPLYIPKCGPPGQQAKHRPSHGPAVPLWRDHEVATTLPGVVHVDTTLPPPPPPYHEDTIFTSLIQDVPKKLAHEHAHTSCILEKNWWVIDARVSLQIYPYGCQRCLHNLVLQVRSLLYGYQLIIDKEAGTVVDTFLTYTPLW